MRRHKFIAIIGLFFANIVLSAQSMEENPVVRETLDEMFEHIDKSKVPTGLLRDYAFELVDFSKYDGKILSDSNIVDYSRFEAMLRSIRSSAVGVKPFNIVGNVINTIIGNQISGRIPIGVALYKYNYIAEDALTSSKIVYSNGQVYDSYTEDNEWVNPYESEYIFGFSPMCNIVTGGTYAFSFPSIGILTNQTISKMEFDSGIGTGYKIVTAGSTTSVTYSSAGNYELKLRITLSDGTVLQGHSIMFVSDGLGSGELSVAVPSNNCKSFISSQAYNGVTTTAKVRWLYKYGNNKITNPYIIVEGFDPASILPPYGVTCLDMEDSDFINTLRNEYDVLYVEWDSSEEYMQANAYLLIDIIQWINDQKAANGSNARNIVHGKSMGGLIVRYALCRMEQDDVEHETSCYISHDSPHHGANIPLGALYAAHSLLSFVYGSNIPVDLSDYEYYAGVAQQYLYANGVRQILMNSLNKYGVLDNSFHEAWQDELDGMGFPQGDDGMPLRNLCITNGGQIQQYGNHYLYLHGRASLNVWTELFNIFVGSSIINVVFGPSEPSLALLNSLIGSTSISVSFEINPYASNSSKLAGMNVTYTKRFLWLFDIDYTIYEYNKYAPSSGIPIDIMPGSYYSAFLEPASDLIQDLNDIKLSYPLLNIDLTTECADRIMFIPSASSLYIGCGNMEPSVSMFDVNYTADNIKSYSHPYDAVIFTNGATEHISYPENVAEWIMNQQSILIEGPISPVNNDVYSVANLTGTILWRTSNRNIAEIDSSGKITVHKNGFITIYADCISTDHSSQVTLEKRVMIGMPNFTLSDISFNPSSKTKYLSFVPNDSEFDKFKEDLPVVYHWGINYNSTTRWTESTSNYYSLNTANYSSSGISFIVVYVYATNGISISDTYSIVFPGTNSDLDPVPSIPPFIMVNSDAEFFLPSSMVLESAVTKSSRDQIKLVLDDELEIIVDRDADSASIMQKLIEMDAFTGMISNMQPWGTDEIMLIKVDIYEENDYLCTQLMKILYKDI